MLDIRVQITGRAKVHRKGNFDPISKWHWDTGTKVPAELTDEMWEKVSSIISNTQKWKDVRGAFEVLVEKVRTGRVWMDYDKDARLGGRAYASLMRRVRHWDETGEYRQALEVLASYPQAPAAPQFSLPPMLVTGAIEMDEGGISAGQRRNGEKAKAAGRSPSGFTDASVMDLIQTKLPTASED